MYHGAIEIDIIGEDPVFSVIEQAKPLSPFNHKVVRVSWEDLAARMRVFTEKNRACASPEDLEGTLPTLVIAKVAEVEDISRLEVLMDAVKGFHRVLEPQEGVSTKDQFAYVRPLFKTRLIALVSKEFFGALEPVLSQLEDVWLLPLDKDESAFRFHQWQQRFKEAMDSWETSQFLESVINSMPSLVWYKTADGIHVKVNDSFCDVVGKTKDDVQGRGHAYIWDVDQDDPACIESENKVMSSRQTGVAEEMVQTGDEMRLLTTYKSPLYNLDGSVMGTVGIGIDITQERAYEQDLLQKNDTLESIFTAMDCGVLTHSLDGSRVLGINQAALNLLGYDSAEDMLSAGFDMFAASVLEEDAEKMRQKLAGLKNVGDSISTEYRVRHDDGTLIHVIGNIKLIERDGELLYQRFLLDYSERKKAEEAREKRQQELVRALSEDYVAVFAMDMSTGEGETLRLAEELGTRLSQAMKNLPSVERLLSEYINTLVFSDDRQLMEEAVLRKGIHEHLKTSDRYHVLYRAKSRSEAPADEPVDDALEYCQATVVQVGNWTDGEHNVVIGFRNVDAETRAEMQQKALLEEALFQARRASEAKSTFLSNMSHDIRTPMNAIIGFTTLASNHIEDQGSVSEYLDKIHASSSHLLSLINDILDMSRIESGNIALEEQPCRMGDIVDGFFAIIEPEAKMKDLHLEVMTEGCTDVVIMADKLKVNQIMLNLLGNSVKFTPKGGFVRLIMEELPLEATEDRVPFRIVVQDNGVGMTEDFIQHIFDPFERERTSTISGIQGTGLGMAITKRLVDMMEGSITVRSKKSVGTEFMLTLSFAKATDEEAVLAERPSIARVTQSAHLKGYRVLLVDDNRLNREIAITLLEDAGFEVDYAVDGQDAIDKIQAAEPEWYSLVLMDIQMPIVNGYEAATAIRKMDNPLKAGIPILAVTADAFDEDRKKALDSGMNGHLAKPIEVEALFEELDNLLM